MEKKKCACCVRKVSLGNFAKDRRTKDGLQSWCRKCHSDYYKGLVKLCPCCGRMMPLNNSPRYAGERHTKDIRQVTLQRHKTSKGI